LYSRVCDVCSSMAPPAGKDSAALASALGKRAPKTARGRRILRKREGQVVEEPKSALLIRGNKCANDVQIFMRDLQKLRSPLATLYMRKHDDHPFEDMSRLENMCVKNDNSLFVFGSSSKKRPFRVIFGRLFDSKFLDMLEFGVSDFKPMDTFKASRREAVAGAKPLVVFQGAAFETNEQLKRTKSLLLDYFGGPRPEKVLLGGVDSVVVCSTFDALPTPGSAGAPADSDPPVTVRRFLIRQLKSGSKLPRVELDEIGPSFKLKLDRGKGPDKDRWKQAIKVPKQVKPKKTKNVSTHTMGERKGRLHLGKQDFNQIHTVHHGLSKRKEIAAAEKSAAKKAKEANDGQEAADKRSAKKSKNVDLNEGREYKSEIK